MRRQPDPGKSCRLCLRNLTNTDEHDLMAFRSLLSDPDLPERIVPHANGMRKLEIGQINTLLLSAREVRGGVT